ncbi:MAG: type ISP restriction/modification enzyme [Fimbriimonadaceae bacterium]
MDPLETYFRSCAQLRNVGVAEQSFYPAIKVLLDEIGGHLKPKVVYASHPQAHERNLPDAGLFTAAQLRWAGDILPFEDPNRLKPDRGVVEVKSLSEDLNDLVESEQVRRYLASFGQVLATNLRQFALIQLQNGQAVEVERYSLANSASEFWRLTENAKESARVHGKFVEEFLNRALLAATTIAQPKDVAAFLASYAREARGKLDLNENILELTALQKTLEDALGVKFEGDKGDDFFRSTLVQTLFYGVFSAWVLWHEQGHSSRGPFEWRQTHYYLRVPVIERLFVGTTSARVLEQAGLNDTLRNAENVLNRVDRAEFFQAFERGLAVQYFYEPFLAAFDPELRKQLGIWYTPPEIVRYMVARVDHILRTELNEPDGLASPNVLVLDPCCGTGAYLVECLNVIAKRYEERGEARLHGDDLKKAVTDRLFGFELLPGPFVVSHLQLGFLLTKLGVHLQPSERAGVYLTNALTGWEPISAERRQLDPLSLYAESDAAGEVKRGKPILVVIGNPPYNGYAGISKMDEEKDLVERYDSGKRRGQGLNDLYVRFFAMADRRIEATGRGVVCLISNYSWLDGLSFAHMRKRYLETFDRIWIDNLNGDKYATGKTTPEGKPDPSVFSTEFNKEGIQVGTAIAALVRRGPTAHSPYPSHLPNPSQSSDPPDPTDTADPSLLSYRDFWGAQKRQELLELAAETDQIGRANPYHGLAPNPGLGHPFKPRIVSENYIGWPTLPEILPKSFPGINTARDSFLIDIDEAKLRQRIQLYYDRTATEAEIISVAPAALQDTSGFDARATRSHLLRKGIAENGFRRYLYRPFDVRWMYWIGETKLIDRSRHEFEPYFQTPNIGIICAEAQRRMFSPPMVVRALPSYHVIERASLVFPLGTPEHGGSGLFGEDIPDPSRVNFSPQTNALLSALQIADDPGAIFFHILAILHSPAYAEENAGALRQDWPRIPIPGWTPGTPSPSLDGEGAGGGEEAATIIRAGAALGRKLANLLDPEQPVPGVTAGDIPDHLAKIADFQWPHNLPNPSEDTEDLALKANWGYRGQGGAVMPGGGKVVWHNRPTNPDLFASGESPSGSSLAHPSNPPPTVDIIMNENGRWTGIPEAVWHYNLGGYQVLKKWLSYRQREVLGRPMKLDEVREFSRIARRIASILAMSSELDSHYRNSAAAASQA